MTWKGQITGCYVCVYLNTYDMYVHVITNMTGYCIFTILYVTQYLTCLYMSSLHNMNRVLCVQSCNLTLQNVYTCQLVTQYFITLDQIWQGITCVSWYFWLYDMYVHVISHYTYGVYNLVTHYFLLPLHMGIMCYVCISIQFCNPILYLLYYYQLTQYFKLYDILFISMYIYLEMTVLHIYNLVDIRICTCI